MVSGTKLEIWTCLTLGPWGKSLIKHISTQKSLSRGLLLPSLWEVFLQSSAPLSHVLDAVPVTVSSPC